MPILSNPRHERFAQGVVTLIKYSDHLQRPFRLFLSPEAMKRYGDSDELRQVLKVYDATVHETPQMPVSKRRRHRRA